MTMLQLGIVLVLGLLAFGCSSDGGSTPAEPPAPKAAPAPVVLTWNLTGTLGDGWPFEGQVTYEKDAQPESLNVRGLQPNAVYPLGTWDLTIHVTYPGIPNPITLSAAPKHEFCLGVCIFDPTARERLYWSNGLQELQLVWFFPTMPVIGTPDVNTDWGAFDPTASWLKTYNPDGTFQYLIFASNAHIALEEETP